MPIKDEIQRWAILQWLSDADWDMVNVMQSTKDGLSV